MRLKWIQILYLLVLYYLVKSHLVVPLLCAVGKIRELEVIADVVVYSNRYTYIIIEIIIIEII